MTPDPTHTLLQLRIALEASGEVIFMTDRQGVFTYVNPEFVRLYGYTAADVVGVHTPRILKGGTTTAGEYDAFWRELVDHTVVRRQFTNKTKAGRMVHVESSANPIVADGTCLGFLAVQRDITERTKVETALRVSEARYRTLAEAAHDSIFIVNRASEIEYANSASLAPFGRRTTDAIGRKLSDVFPPSTAATMWDELTQVFESGERRSFETSFDTPTGDLWLETWLVPMPNAGDAPNSVMGVSRNITTRKILERQFLQAQKMEAIGRLAGGVAHDFNNLLTAIIGYSDLLLDRMHDDASVCADVQEIKRAGESAARLTRQLLTFSRQHVAQPEILDLNVVVGNVQKMLDRVLGDDVQLRVRAESGLHRVNVDAGQIEQVILNLAVNARDAMPQGGRVVLTTANTTVGVEMMRMCGAAAPGQYVSLAVSDTGCGMSADVLAHACEPFFTTKPIGQGTGLGLATVFGIAKQSGGFVAIDSTPGLGTTVTAYFPVAVHAGMHVRSPERTGTGEGKETILLVEDEPRVRRLMQRTLEDRGYSVIAPATASDALEIARSSPREIHLLLSDIVMPELSGPELAQRIAYLRPHIRVLYVSGFPNRVQFGSDMISSRVAFLAKPFAPRTLALTIRDCLAAQSRRDVAPAAAK